MQYLICLVGSKVICPIDGKEMGSPECHHLPYSKLFGYPPGTKLVGENGEESEVIPYVVVDEIAAAIEETELRYPTKDWSI
jgi:hypothetical protein